MPSDLLMLANRESEEWAREQAIAHMYETFGKLGSWDHVRNVVNVQ